MENLHSATPAPLFCLSLLLAMPQLPPDKLADAQVLATHFQNWYRPVQPSLISFCFKTLKDLLNFIAATTGSIFTYKINLLIQQIKAPTSKTLNTLEMAACECFSWVHWDYGYN